MHPLICCGGGGGTNAKDPVSGLSGSFKSKTERNVWIQTNFTPMKHVNWNICSKYEKIALHEIATFNIEHKSTLKKYIKIYINYLQDAEEIENFEKSAIHDTKVQNKQQKQMKLTH